jgi:hypothetical protein
MGFSSHDFILFIAGFAAGAIVLLLAGFRRQSTQAPLPAPVMPTFAPAAPAPAKVEVPEPPKAPQTVEVDPHFRPREYPPDDCVWVRSESLQRFESDGYTYYHHPANGAKCVRYFEGDVAYLMVNPYAEKLQEPTSEPSS